MKILFVYDTYHLYGGGSQIISFSWFENLNKLGKDVYYLSNDYFENNDLTYKNKVLLNKGGIKIDELIPGFKIPLFINFNFLELIIKNKFDIIQFFEPSLIGLELILLKKFIKSKQVFYFSTIFETTNKRNFFDKTGLKIVSSLQKIFFEFSDAIIFPSNYLKNIFRKEFKNKKTKTIYPPIRDYFFDENFKIKTKEPTELVIVSRLVKEKNIDVIIKTLKYLKADFKLNIIGDGKDREYYEKLVKKLNLKEKVIFWGWIKHRDLPQLIKNFDIFIFPSSIETFGIVQIEALASGLPLITSENELNKEIIPHNMAIFLKKFDPKNLAKILIKLKKEKKLFLKLQENIKKDYFKLLKYHEETSTKNLVNFYKTLI